jgi:hypothetical protein
MRSKKIFRVRKCGLSYLLSKGLPIFQLGIILFFKKTEACEILFTL